jgi:hypothetical protein
MKIRELLFDINEWQTIASATDSKGHVSRAKSDEIADPNGWFAKNKKNIKGPKFKPAGKDK